jgi:hypothetical protein
MPALALVLVLAACSSARTTAGPSPSPSPRPAAVARCAWYTPTIVRGAADGQQVIIAATGPACGDPPVIDWIADITGKPWGSTALVIGSCIAQLARGGSVVQVWQTGFAEQTDRTAGQIADTLEGDGWRVEVPPGGGPTPPPISSTAGEPGV